MFKVKIGDIREEAFQGACEKIFNFTEFDDQKVIYNIAKISRRLSTERTQMTDQLNKIAKKHVELDDKGNYVWKDGIFGRMIPKSDEDKAAYDKAIEELSEIEIAIDCHKIPFEKLLPVKLSPIEICAVEMMLSDLEAATTKDKAPTPIRPNMAKQKTAKGKG